MIALAFLARAVLRSVLGGIARASTQAFNQQNMNNQAPPEQGRARQQQSQQQRDTFTGGDLHRDPVCGTYVAESSSVRRQAGGQTFYYCSEACREKHALAARAS